MLDNISHRCAVRGRGWFNGERNLHVRGWISLTQNLIKSGTTGGVIFQRNQKGKHVSHADGTADDTLPSQEHSTELSQQRTCDFPFSM